MGVTFDRWLAKPSTLCFLRRVIQCETTKPLRLRRHAQTCRYQSATAALGHNEEDGDAEGEPAKSKVDMRSVHPPEHLKPSRRLLFMSLRSGVPIVPQDINVGSAWGELLLQADVDSDKLVGKLAVDEPENKHNMALWAEILNVRQRLHGSEGIRAVWNGMARRAIDLPTDGDYADILWQAFIHATISSPKEAWNIELDQCLTTEKVLAYAQKLKQTTGRQYPKLYKVVVGHWLRIEPTLAFKWHRKLEGAGLAISDCFLHVVDDLMSIPASRPAFRGFFRVVYKESHRRDLYETIVDSAHRHETSERTILSYHKLLIASGDLPSEAYSNEPRVARLFRLAKETEPSTSKYNQVLADHKHASQAPYATVNREMMNKIVGEVHDIKPKELSDGFCARMFATRAFSIGWVIQGLALFGVERLGPLAIREMAVRVGSPQAFCDEFANLESAQIGLVDAMFSRLVVKVAKEGNEELWQALLDSDQHPEAYDDERTQTSLLTLHLKEEKWAQAHLGLLVASLAGLDTTFEAWNCVLQHYMLNYDYPATVSILTSMQIQEMPLTQHTINLLGSHMLPPRQVSKRQAKGRGPGYFEPTEFVAKAYMYASQKHSHDSEQYAQPRSNQWVEVLKRLGMNHQWAQFERVVLTLLSPSEPLNGDEVEDDASPEFDWRRTPRLRAIFSSNMRKAFFIWGFRSASIRDKLRPPPVVRKEESQASTTDDTPCKQLSVEPWAQGLPLLRHLRSTGFEFDVADVRIALVQRMWILFGPGYSTRAINQEARRNNRLSLAHYIRHANEVWDGLVDWVEPELLERDDDARLLPAFFGDFMSTSSKRGEGADVKAWAEALSSGAQHVIEPKKTRAKEAAWMQSPLRKYPSSHN